MSAAEDVSIADALAGRAFAIAPEFLAPEAVSALHREATRRLAAGEFRAARVGRAGAAQRDPAIRGDSTCWIDAGGATPPEAALLARVDVLRLALNRALFLGLAELEAHYACYPPGGAYARHVDRFRDDDARAISLVLYLNESWRPEDGGALRIYAPADSEAHACEVLPLGGTLVAFRSETIAHEVLPARRQRLSIAGWLRRRA